MDEDSIKKITNDENRRVLKGGSFIDSRDGHIESENEDEQQNLKIRISARLGRSKTYTAQNVGFRCAQSIRQYAERFGHYFIYNIVFLD